MNSDRAFYERRLQEELYWAAAEEEATLKFLHLRWANLYRDRLRRLDREQFLAA